MRFEIHETDERPGWFRWLITDGKARIAVSPAPPRPLEKCHLEVNAVREAISNPEIQVVVVRNAS